ncbi:MAG TPA: efflux transporter outer membrane subunit [Casimicrobiaceae bacterium]|nr:efflux transporter outer membrane subunit [Casimicrobiaceae bacterium]
MRARSGILLASGVLSACVAVGPDYRKPEVPMPALYSARIAVDQTAGRAELRAWWKQFGDRELDALIARALEGNLDLQSAASRISQAREQTIIAGANALPTLGADADVNRTRLSANSGISQLASQFGGNPGSGHSGNGGQGAGGGGFSLPGSGFSTYTLGFDASWEIDLFGGTRRAVQAAQANAEAAVWDRRDSEVSVAAEVASDYLALRTVQRQIAIAREEIARQRQTLALTEARRKSGFVTELDVRQQRAQLALAEAMPPELDAQALAQVHALGVLLGQPPETLEAELAKPNPVPAGTPNVPVGLPSDLLRRRPDIRAAERQVAAANAEIGVAVADLYPKFDLTGVLDFVSLDLRHLLDLSSRQYSATAAISWPIFAGGKIRANIRVNEEKTQQALFAYRKAVLGALSDVENALTRYSDEQAKHRALTDALAEAERAHGVAFGQYKAGLIDFTPVLAAQGTVLTTRDQLSESDGALDRDLVSLYKALGGGWSDAKQ